MKHATAFAAEERAAAKSRRPGLLAALAFLSVVFLQLSAVPGIVAAATTGGSGIPAAMLLLIMAGNGCGFIRAVAVREAGYMALTGFGLLGASTILFLDLIGGL